MNDFPVLEICDCDPFSAVYMFDPELVDYICAACGGLRPDIESPPPANTLCPACGGSGSDDGGGECNVCAGWGYW